MIQRREWTPLSQPGLLFVIGWDDDYADSLHRCVSATRDGEMLWPPQVHYEQAIAAEKVWREANISCVEMTEKRDGKNYIRFDIGNVAGAKKFKDVLHLPDGHSLTADEIQFMQDARYANWLAVAHPNEKQRASIEAAALAEALAETEKAIVVEETIDG
jgi:hypothetical protein